MQCLICVNEKKYKSAVNQNLKLFSNAITIESGFIRVDD